MIAIVWTGLILYWVHGEHFEIIRPQAKIAERVDQWFTEISMLDRSESGKFGDIPVDRQRLIQKAADTGVYYLNDQIQNFSEPEIKAYNALLTNGLSKKVVDTVAGVCSERHIKAVKSSSGIEHCARWISDTPKWDFRGVDGMNLETLSEYVRSTIHQLNEIQIFDGYDSMMMPTSHFTGEFTGLITEDDYSLLNDLLAEKNSRWILKPIFWGAAWLVPLLGLGLVTFIVVELLKWIIRGFKPASA